MTDNGTRYVVRQDYITYAFPRGCDGLYLSGNGKNIDTIYWKEIYCSKTLAQKAIESLDTRDDLDLEKFQDYYIVHPLKDMYGYDVSNSLDVFKLTIEETNIANLADYYSGSYSRK